MDWHDTIIPEWYYDRNPIEVAKDLLGTFLVRKLRGQCIVGKIVETEAYLASGDPASHNFKGITKRNKSLYTTAGHAYVHSMRQYCLIDVVTEASHKPGSVLLRALEPVEGIKKMKEFRKEEKIENLTNGPGKLCLALGITLELDGIHLADSKSELFISYGEDTSPNLMTISTRIGISTAEDMPLRFYISDNDFVSKKY